MSILDVSDGVIAIKFQKEVTQKLNGKFFDYSKGDVLVVSRGVNGIELSTTDTVAIMFKPRLAQEQWMLQGFCADKLRDPD